MINYKESNTTQVVKPVNRHYGESIYKKVDNEKRLFLLTMIKEEGISLKEASKKLDINYSTAKTILRVYRLENRILKKSSLGNVPKKIRCPSTDTESEKISTSLKGKPEDNNNKQFEVIKVPPTYRLGNVNYSKELFTQLRQITESVQVCVQQVVRNDFLVKDIVNRLNSTGLNNLFNQAVNQCMTMNEEEKNKILKLKLNVN